MGRVAREGDQTWIHWRCWSFSSDFCKFSVLRLHLILYWTPWRSGVIQQGQCQLLFLLCDVPSPFFPRQTAGRIITLGILGSGITLPHEQLCHTICVWTLVLSPKFISAVWVAVLGVVPMSFLWPLRLFLYLFSHLLPIYSLLPLEIREICPLTAPWGPSFPYSDRKTPQQTPNWTLGHEPEPSLPFPTLALSSEIPWVFPELLILLGSASAIPPCPQEPSRDRHRPLALPTFWLFFIFCAFPSTLPRFLFCWLLSLQQITSLPDGVLVIHCFFILMKTPNSLAPRAGSLPAPSPLLVLWKSGSTGILPCIIPLSASGVTARLERESSSSGWWIPALCCSLKEILNSEHFLNKELLWPHHRHWLCWYIVNFRHCLTEIPLICS